MKVLYEINKLIKKGKKLAMNHKLKFVGLTIVSGEYAQVTYHLEVPEKGIELN